MYEQSGSTPTSATGAIVLTDILLRIDDPSLAWERLADGIEIHRLYTLASGQSAALLRYQPGAKLPRHWHVGLEHVLVLRGSQSDENGLHTPGTILIHPPGTAHSVRSDEGCVALAIWERPVVFEPPADVSRL